MSGFVSISQTAKQLVFCGTFTAGGLEVRVESGRIRIVREGAIRNFLPTVEPVSFSAKRAREVEQKVLYVTERAVFRLGADGLELLEVAPGIDRESQVLGLMDFRPLVRDVRPMPVHVFTPGHA